MLFGGGSAHPIFPLFLGVILRRNDTPLPPPPVPRVCAVRLRWRDCVEIATALEAVDRFASEGDTDHQKLVSKLDAENSEQNDTRAFLRLKHAKSRHQWRKADGIEFVVIEAKYHCECILVVRRRFSFTVLYESIFLTQFEIDSSALSTRRR